MSRLKRRILEEMVFERLLGAIDPERILELGRELDHSLERAVEPDGSPRRDPAELKLALLRRALVRLEETLCDLAMEDAPLM